MPKFNEGDRVYYLGQVVTIDYNDFGSETTYQVRFDNGDFEKVWESELTKAEETNTK